MKRKLICAAVCLSVLLAVASCGSESGAKGNSTAADVSAENAENSSVKVTVSDVSPAEREGAGSGG